MMFRVFIPQFAEISGKTYIAPDVKMARSPPMRGARIETLMLRLRIPLKVATDSRRKRPPNPRETCHPYRGKVATCRSEATRDGALLFRKGGGRQLCVTFSHRFSLQIDPVSVVYKTIQDGVGQGRIADDLVPMIDG